jgi:drug/metabolite transporter (DMT)-like permease
MERLILFIYPTIVVIITALIYKKPVKKFQMVALCLTYTGIILAFSFDTNISAQKDLFTGGFLIFLCAITYAIFIFGSGKMIPRLGTIKFTAYAMSISAMAIFIHFALINEGGIFSFNKEIYILSFLMAVFATVIPSFMISEGIRIIGSDNASIISSIGPISTIILAYFFLKETISFIQVAGTIFVLGGVLLISLKKE